MAKYKVLEEDNKQIFLNESPYLGVLTVHNGWHQNSEQLAQKVCDLLNQDVAQQQTVSKREDAEIMFDALFQIISDEEINTVHKCMMVCNKAINSLLDQSIIDKKYNHNSNGKL